MINLKFFVLVFISFLLIQGCSSKTEPNMDHIVKKIVEVETPHKLKPAQIESLKLLFKNKYESDIEIEEIINEQLLAGIKVKINDEVIDLSLQNRFTKNLWVAQCTRLLVHTRRTLLLD